MSSPGARNGKHHLLLVDYSNLVMRMFFRKGEPSTSQLAAACLQAIKGACKEWDASLCVVSLDPRNGHSFGYDLYPDYKNSLTRSEEDGVTASALTDATFAYLERAGVCTVEKPGYEADHLIATLAERAKGKGTRVSILSRDRDLWALCEDGKVRCLYPDKGKERIVRTKEVLDALGVSPHQVEDLKVISGDKSDNIPRLGEWDTSKAPFGFTEKRAARLLRTYETLEAVYANLMDLPHREQEWLVKDKGSLEWRRKLIHLQRDVPLDVDVSRARVK